MLRLCIPVSKSIATERPMWSAINPVGLERGSMLWGRRSSCQQEKRSDFDQTLRVKSVGHASLERMVSKGQSWRTVRRWRKSLLLKCFPLRVRESPQDNFPASWCASTSWAKKILEVGEEVHRRSPPSKFPNRCASASCAKKILGVGEEVHRGSL